LDIADEHYKLIEWLLRAGRPVRIRLNVENQFSRGPVECANIVGEIRGSEHPEQIVVVAAHLDSWDLGTGAIDDGFGTAGVLAAAEALVKSGVKPRCTIRFVLFTGEEQGLLGSRAYVEKHRAELANIVGTFALDWGQGPITKLPVAGHEELLAPFQHFAEAIADVQTIQAVKGYLFSTDAYAFTLAGLPGISLFQDSPTYTEIGHSAADTLDKVDPQVLVKDAEVLALAAFWMADSPERLGELWTPQKTAEVLRRDKQRETLEQLGMWPFPN
jgi:Zn-dependent M28 family amino/carboxypeptidase